MTENAPRHVVLARGNACTVCRRKKIKCDGSKPACGPCTRIGARDRCTFPTSYPPRATTQRKPKSGSLAGRVDELKVQISDVKKSQNLSGSAPSTAISSLGAGTSTSRFLPSQPSQPRVGTQAYDRLAPSHVLRPSPLDIPISLRDPVVTLLKQRDLPPNVQDSLVNVFLKRRSHNFMAWSMSKFWAAYKLPPSHPESIHPAFLNAMCLYGCSYGPSSTRVYEPLFYARLQRSLADCLASADRLHDFMRASALAAVYCFHRKRYAVGQNHLAATIHLAVACGLDKIDSCDVSSASISRLLRSPRDATDLGDMIHTWWGLFCMDRIASTLLECPTTIPENDDVITTIWPCKFEDYASGQAIHAAYSGTASLRTPPGDLTIAVSVYENVYAFRAKSVGLLFHTMTLTPSHQERNVDQIRDTRITIDVASRLSEIMVAYRQEMCPTFSCTRYCENDGHDSTLIFAMTTCYTALIRLLTVSADKDQGSYQRRLKIARDCVALGAEAYSTDPHLAAPCIVFAWCASYEVFAWEVVRLNKLGEGEAATAALLEVEAAMNLIRRLVQIFETFKKKWPVQNLQRFNIHKAELAKWSKH